MSGRKIADFEKQMKKEEDFFNRIGGGPDILPIDELGVIEDFSFISDSNGWKDNSVEKLGDQRDSDRLSRALSQCKSMGIFG